MQTVKPSGEDLAGLLEAARILVRSNKALNEAKKSADAAKEKIEQWLKSNRGIELEALKIGDMVLVDQVCLIERSKMTKFDERAFLIAHPALHEEFKKDIPVTKWKPVLPGL